MTDVLAQAFNRHEGVEGYSKTELDLLTILLPYLTGECRFIPLCELNKLIILANSAGIKLTPDYIQNLLSGWQSGQGRWLNEGLDTAVLPADSVPEP